MKGLEGARAEQQKRQAVEGIADVLLGGQKAPGNTAAFNALAAGGGPTNQAADILATTAPSGMTPTGGQSTDRDALVDTLMSNPGLVQVAQNAAARKMFPSLYEETLSPRDKAFLALTPEQQARSLNALAPEPSARDEAFARMTPDQQVMSLGGAPKPRQLSAFEEAFSSLSPEAQTLYFTKPQTQVTVGPQSPQGKVINDRQRLVDAYGEDSPEVQRFDALAQPPKEDKPLTVEASKAAGFANRMVLAAQTLNKMEAGGFDPATLQQAAGQRLLGGNYILTSDQQVYAQQQEDWVRAKLRQESGAVIGDQEMIKEIQTYFPQPGDGPEVIAQKAKSRRVAEETMIGQSQGGFKRLFPDAQTIWQQRLQADQHGSSNAPAASAPSSAATRSSLAPGGGGASTPRRRELDGDTYEYDAKEGVWYRLIE